MRDGFLKVGAASIDVRPADIDFNIKKAVEAAQNAHKEGAKLLVLPELCVTGYTAGDLFNAHLLCERAVGALLYFARATQKLEMVSVLGVPVKKDGMLYSCAAVVSSGKILGIVPKSYIPDNKSFATAPEGNSTVCIDGQEVKFGTKLLFCCKNMDSFVLAAELSEDMWSADAMDTRHTLAGATVVAVPSANYEAAGRAEYRRSLLKMRSAQLCCTHICAQAGEGESSTDYVFSGHSIIAETGHILSEAERFKNGIIYGVTDLQKVLGERQRCKSFEIKSEGYERIYFSIPITETKLPVIDTEPFIPANAKERAARCEEILMMQSAGLKKRMLHTGVKKAVIGISGGLDSSLALMVTVRAFDMAGLSRENICAITMPCFGTSDRTYKNALAICRELGVSLREIRIEKAVSGHFEDIGQDKDCYDVTYENSQARERTQVLFDIANKEGAIVVGTGDLSELALGWATYGGDHLSSYGVNGSVPKTLVRCLVRYEAQCCGGEIERILLDVCDTPVSPELLPPDKGSISQKTEQLVGPYKLSDFFLYHMIRYGFSPKKIYRMAVYAFEGEFDGETVKKWLAVFIKRFFSQQFKRSCLPDGPKVGSVSLSPRGDFKMPSDASAALWLSELEEER